ncbi:ATP-binding protein [Primorskyibacter flagellatus]|uniref:histidine kinase n=1 Tax=Primorskyibacter flagellatus TaxID=1387277 RepID=A0A1W1ZGF1_9RHOB|nr:ATP-binding protein [Primorskyibacter flagellatus]SMC47484.1 two-component system, OmpR family, osmolarity sensor histidine kinase EnvZ [Primorskyibacter flagellatus]
MSFRWLKHYMPRGLYGRALLILVLPVVTLQLVVSIVFIQRHFEGVSLQMSTAVARELNLILDAGGERPLSQALSFDVRQVASTEVPPASQRRWYDFSGIVVIRTLTEKVPRIRAVDLPTDRLVTVYADGPEGPVAIDFSRLRASAENPHQLLVNMVIFGVLMTVIAYLYLRNQLRPITRLAEVSQAFGRGRAMPYQPAGAVEVRAAGHAFLDMRARIERQIEQRTMMLSGVSHDLRTPLTRMKLGLSMLDEKDAAPLERDVQDMERLVDAFLDFARDDVGKTSAEPVDPVALVGQLVEDARRGGKDVTLTEVEGSGEVALRPMAIKRAVENLINNAVRYGSRAEVSVALTGKSLRFRVEDDGPGIPADRREHAIKPFVRLDPARNQDRGSGVGLGLAIAADVARSHGGILRLGESAKLGGLRADIVIAR